MESEIENDEAEEVLFGKKDFSLEAKVRAILDNDNPDVDGDEFKVTSYNFNGMIHDIITPKNYDKECKISN